MKLSEFKTDTDLETDGVWIDIEKGTRIKVARFGNKKHQEALDRLKKPYRAMLNAGRSLPDDIAENILIEGMVEGILLGWEGIFDEDGKTAIPFSKEAARKALAIKDFRDIVAGISIQRDVYRRHEVEDATKNSKPTSTGN